MKEPDILDYYKLKGKRKLSDDKYNNEFRLLKKSLHKQYVKTHKWQFRILDLALIFIILFNLGALFTTEMLVVKAEPDAVFVEANQIQCDWQGFACAPPAEGRKAINTLVTQSILWALIIFVYVYHRSKVFSDSYYYLIVFVVLVYLTLTGLDFIGNLGSYIGKVIWGY